MKKDSVTIAVIDSGIDKVFIRDNRVRLAGGLAVEIDSDNRVLERYEYDDSDLLEWIDSEKNILIQDMNGHGTEIFSIIWNAVRDARYFVVKILDAENSAHSLKLLEALKWVVANTDADYINMSLGEVSPEMIKPVDAVLKQASEKNMKIYCAASHIPTFPAQSKYVTTIGDEGLLRFLTMGAKVDFVIEDKEIELYCGNRWCKKPISTSYACAMALRNHILMSNI